MLVCPYCGKPNEIPVDAAFDSIEAGHFTCGHCNKAFYVIDHVPKPIESIKNQIPKNRACPDKPRAQ
jgi:uncharacterized protein YbaR (Trm112 family)